MAKKKQFGYYNTDDQGLPFGNNDYSLKTVSREDQNLQGIDNFGKQDLSLAKLNDYKLTESTSSTPDAPSSGMSNQQAVSTGKGVMKIIGGYMQADAIRKQANYEADILQLNADLSLFEAGEQRGVDFSKIIRYGQQVDETVGQVRGQFAQLEQEGGAAQDVIRENSLQGKLNQIAMMNEAQARVSSADFQRRLSYFKAKKARDISRAQGRQAVAAGYIGAANDAMDAAAKGAGGGAG